MVVIDDRLSIPEDEIQESFIRSAGPGGQNVNKVATAVQLRFDVAGSMALPPDVKQRVMQLLASRLTNEGVLVITARRFRTQDQNRRDARERLADILREATRKPKKRRPTRATAGSKERRLDHKRRHASKKQGRGRKDWD